LVFYLPAHGQNCHKAASAIRGLYLRMSESLSAWLSISARNAAQSLFSRTFALCEKMGGTGGIGDYIEKPKGMHWRTFE
jgi:hypothetical protein